MAITQTPGITYNEINTDPNANGVGAEIPIFIGISGNSTPYIGIQKFKKYEDACVEPTATTPGLGTSLTNNPLLETVQKFFNEAKKIQADDIGIPYIYAIDLGNITLRSGEQATNASESTITAWTNAMKLAKTVQEVTMEAYVGFKSTDTPADYLSLMVSADEKIKEYVSMCQPRIGYFTVKGATDNVLISLTNDSANQHSRICLIEPNKFGEILARIATTPYYEEPGYYAFRSINPGEFTERSKEEELALQNAGIIFGRDEKVGNISYPKICLGVSTAFAADEDARPKDSLLHARRNVDRLIRDTYVTIYPQLKRNETEGYLSYAQADIDTLISNKIDSGYMKEGTYLQVAESDIDPYDLKINGEVLPINATYTIGVNIYLGDI